MPMATAMVRRTMVIVMDPQTMDIVMEIQIMVIVIGHLVMGIVMDHLTMDTLMDRPTVDTVMIILMVTNIYIYTNKAISICICMDTRIIATKTEQKPMNSSWITQMGEMLSLEPKMR